MFNDENNNNQGGDDQNNNANNGNTGGSGDTKSGKEVTKEEFSKRFKKATKGYDLNTVARGINNQFDTMRTVEVMNCVALMAEGKYHDVKMLEAVETFCEEDRKEHAENLKREKKK